MKMWVTRFIFLGASLTVLSISQTAYGCCTEVQAREALRSGDFQLAASSGMQLGTINARLIAAEALSAKVLLGIAEDGKDTAEEALRLSESVLAEDSDNLEAQFQYALADGFITRATSPFSAWRKKLPQKTKEIIDNLIANAPQDGRAHALLGAWHMGILRKTGEGNGEKWFGATQAQGKAAYNTALRLRPDDIIITSNYALSLAELDFEANSSAARDMLLGVMAAAPKDAIERDVQARIQDILGLWNDEKALMARIGQFLDGDG